MEQLHLLSMFVSIVIRPGNLLLLALLIATLVVWLRPGKASRGGRFWLTLASALLLFVTFAPVNVWVARPLEDRFPPPTSLPARVDGILVLGGIGQRSIADQRETLAVTGAAERLMVPAALAMQHPDARLVISGVGEDTSSLKDWFADIGLERDRIAFETESHNTFENALFSHRKLQPKSGEVWLLVTSARHMPRAVGVFRKLGWPVVPYPVDYQTADLKYLVVGPDVAEDLAQLGPVFKEWAGLLAYYLMGHTDALWPAPEAP